MNKNVAFFYPAENIGGAQNLFLRAAKYLALNNYFVHNIDYGNSYITTQLNAENVKFEHVILSGVESCLDSLPYETTLILSLSYIDRIKDHFGNNERFRFLFWDLHPNNLIDQTFFSFFYKKRLPQRIVKVLKVIERQRIEKLRKLIELANEKNGLAFMCRNNYLINQKFFDLNIEPSYLPIIQDALVEAGSHGRSFKKYKKQINLAWLSRLEKDKVAILNLLIQDCENYAFKNDNEIQLNLHVIGEGSAVEQIIRAQHCNIYFAGKLFKSELSNYLKKNVDVGFSMGTSALEFAARGLPSVLVPSSTLPDYFGKREKRYMWLHNVEGYDVAAEVYHENNVLNDFTSIQRYLMAHTQVLANRSVDYIKSNHSLEKVGEKLSLNIENCKLTLSDIKSSGFYSPTMAEKILRSFKTFFKVKSRGK